MSAPAAHVVIVGGGFCGTLTAIHLLRGGSPLRITLLDRRGAFARGLAYATEAREHVLNVPVTRMSAFPDLPDDLLTWCREQGLPAGSESFLARRDYGRYLSQRLAEAQTRAAAGASTLDLRGEEAVALRPSRGGAELTLGSGARLEADAVVLAWGNLPPADPLEGVGGRTLDAARYARDAWQPGALDGLAPDGGVLVLGAGLTAVDMLLSLRRRLHRGPIVLLSRRGLLPQPQRSPTGAYGGGYDPQPFLAAEGSLRRLLRTFRAEARRREGVGSGWRDVIAALRPVTPRLWDSLPPRDRTRFLRHLRPFWDTHRHRMAPAVEDVLATLAAESAFVIHAGRVREVAPTPGGVRVRWQPRGRADTETLEVERAINATGAAADPRATGDPFVRSLVDGGWVQPDPLGLGIEVQADGRVPSSDPALPACLWALGGLRTGLLWESTAVPELRGQAQALAKRLIEALPRSGR